mmetsp:Transcript_12860/g.17572  ORF Transcript_12860/g.17572 Transcript_12860/m.17572 type:complete len:365 (+) Transcript_12860:61-1155(+)|eukprot:CAMPEP_0196590340 /NCGR_PEP_ID=MMETSP1081-20130531/66324_1 /TAXON_ID=36882 /ORGANISM="Pyramimonas amylifera, Strain CCMP720" /LENGTH=364 /DNA_ID=CAMNT_0041913411 /DNA_START=39 /DNA_END=1133 /DNA_ORIENTATION=-
MDLANIIADEELDDISDPEEINDSTTYPESGTPGICSQMELEQGTSDGSPDENNKEVSNRSNCIAESPKSTAKTIEPKSIPEDGEIPEKPSIQPEITIEERELAKVICKDLKEKKVHLIRLVVHYIGVDVCRKVFRETLRIEANGGMMCNNKKQRREAGGIFMTLIQEQVSREIMKTIRDAAKPEEKLLKKKLRERSQVHARSHSLGSPIGRDGSYDEPRNVSKSPRERSKSFNKRKAQHQLREDDKAQRKSKESLNGRELLVDKRISLKLKERLAFPSEEAKTEPMSLAQPFPASATCILGPNGEQLDFGQQFGNNVVVDFSTPLNYGDLEGEEEVPVSRIERRPAPAPVSYEELDYGDIMGS